MAQHPHSESRSGNVALAEMTDAPIDVGALAEAVAVDAAGAIATFDGRVRNHDHGAEVTSLEYSAHPAAGDLVAEVAAEVAGRFDVHLVAVAHRAGGLGIGDTALGAAVSASHRGEAFAAVAALVDEVKAKLPVWKKQHFPDGTYEWSNCA